MLHSVEAWEPRQIECLRGAAAFGLMAGFASAAHAVPLVGSAKP